MYFKIAFRNIKVHWRQSLAALLSISAAFISYVLFQGYMADVTYLYFDGYRNRSMYGDLIIENKLAQSTEAQKSPEDFALTQSDQKIIRDFLEGRKQQIIGDVRFLNFQGLISNGASSKILIGQGYDVEQGATVRENWNWNVLYGSPLHLQADTSAVLLGQALARQLGCEPAQKQYSLQAQGGYRPEVRPFTCKRPDLQISVTTVNGNLNAMDFVAVGIVDAGYKDIDSRYLMLSLQNAQKLLNTDSVSFWTVKLQSELNSEEWIADLNSYFVQSAPHLHGIDWRKHKTGDLYNRTMELLNIFRNFVTIVVAFISTLSVMNTMVKIVNERTREIGTLLSLGFHRSYVLKVFITEAALIAILGMSIGIIVSLIATTLVNAMNFHYKAGILSEPVSFMIRSQFSIYVFATLLLFCMTIIASTISCWSTLQKKIVECLGHV